MPPQASEIAISWLDVGLAGCLLAINALISLRLRLAMAGSIVWSSLRMTIQLALLGLVLKQIFALATPLPVIGLAGVMTVIAGASAVGRIEHRYPGIYVNAVASVWISTWLVTMITVLLIVRPQPWYSAPVAIPLLGMVLGNSLTGISLGLDRFLAEMRSRRGELETILAMGATRWECCRDVFAVSTRTAMIPILNTMTVAGIVSIPGMMTGQLLAGAPPIQAVKYQIMIMFVIAAAIGIGIIAALWLTYRQVTTPDHQIRWDTIRKQDR